MLEFFSENGGTILIGFLIFWFVQFGAAYWQMRRFYQRMIVLQKNGLTAVGLCGDRLKGRAYAVLSIDDNNRVVSAEQFSGWTVFAKLQPVPEIVGMRVQAVIDDQATLPVSTKLQTAFANAARDLMAAREKEAANLVPEPA